VVDEEEEEEDEEEEEEEEEKCSDDASCTLVLRSRQPSPLMLMLGAEAAGCARSITSPPPGKGEPGGARCELIQMIKGELCVFTETLLDFDFPYDPAAHPPHSDLKSSESI
jgi:hypothetical protein